MCMGGSPAPPPTPPPPPAPLAPPPAAASSATVGTQGKSAPKIQQRTKSRNPLRTDQGSTDSVATGLNIPV